MPPPFLSPLDTPPPCPQLRHPYARCRGAGRGVCRKDEQGVCRQRQGGRMQAVCTRGVLQGGRCRQHQGGISGNIYGGNSHSRGRLLRGVTDIEGQVIEIPRRLDVVLVAHPQRTMVSRAHHGQRRGHSGHGRVTVDTRTMVKDKVMVAENEEGGNRTLSWGLELE